MRMDFFSRCGRAVARVTRERKTVAAMLRIYCREHHGGARALCEHCTRLHAYAMCRLARCPFGAEKPACANCPIHCYRADRRDEIREVMRFAGPHMLWRHPLLTVRHLLDGRRPAPSSPTQRAPQGGPADGTGRGSYL